jgi:hypothetical protein
MSSWKRLTSTSGGKVDVNLDALAYIDAVVHGSLTVKESPDAVHAAPSPRPAVPTNPNPESTTLESSESEDSFTVTVERER